MNILISSAGRQVFLVKAFKKALNAKGKVFAIDMNQDASALKAADNGIVAPAFTDNTYVDWLIKKCNANDIQLILSLNVDDLIILESNRDKIETSTDATLIAGPINCIRNSNDKLEVVRLCKKLELPVAKTCLISDIGVDTFNHFPAVAKPRFGKGGRGNVFIRNVNDIKNLIANTNIDYVIQEFIEGEEFGFDIINDFNGNFHSLLGRLKLGQRNGESFKAKTIDPSFWSEEANKLSIELKHQGTLNIDVLRKNGEAFIIDINYRFSGDYIFSHIAGSNTPQLYVNFFNGIHTSGKYIPRFGVIGERIDGGAVNLN